MPNNGQNRWRTGPLYTISEAAHLADVSHITIRRWLFGYQTPDGQVSSILGDQEKTPLVSFLQLAEILVAKGFRKNRMPLERIRKAYDFAQKQWNLEYPFAALRLEALGGHILHLFQEEQPGISLVALDTEGKQWTLPGIVIKTIRSFDYESELAARWYPVGKNIQIVVDPRFSAGMPTIKERRVTIGAVYKRFKLGYPIKFIASDLKIRTIDIEEAVRYADKVAV